MAFNSITLKAAQHERKLVSIAGLHDYSKALEYLENSILGGFYYRHFRSAHLKCECQSVLLEYRVLIVLTFRVYSLAVNVIGSKSRGTMNRSVAALKSAYETRLFACLDEARNLLGNFMDERLVENKGRIMKGIPSGVFVTCLLQNHFLLRVEWAIQMGKKKMCLHFC